MHSLPYDRNGTSPTDQTTRLVNPIRKGIDKNGFITRKSAKRDIFLPPINKHMGAVSLANLDTAKGWSCSTKELIAHEWDNLERIKKNGSLSSKYSVLPPINNNVNQGNNHTTNTSDPNSVFNADNLKLMFRSLEIGEEPLQSDLSEKLVSRERQQNKRRRTSKRKERRCKSPNTIPVNPENIVNENQHIDDKKDEKLPEIVPKKSIEPNEPKSEQQQQQLTLPKILSPNVHKKKNGVALEKAYGEKMIDWTRYQGRRNAICYEMDPLFRELTSIIKYNLLVQHLEDIWMC